MSTETRRYLKYTVLIIISALILIYYLSVADKKQLVEEISGPRFSGRGKRDLRSTSNNTQELTESSTGKEHHSRPPRWLQPLSTIFCILLIFGLIMAAVACNIWCVNTGDDLSSHGDSILDIELASSAGATDT